METTHITAIGIVVLSTIFVVIYYWIGAKQLEAIHNMRLPYTDQAMQIARQLADADFETVRALHADKGYMPILKMLPCGHFLSLDSGLEECPVCKDKSLRSDDMLLLPSTPEGMFERWWGAAYPSAETHNGRVARNVFKDGWDAALLVSGNWKEEREEA